MARSVFITTQGTLSVQRGIRAARDLAANMEPAWPEVEEILKVAYINSFAKEGPGWKPLDPDTIRRRGGKGRGMLRVTDKLYRSIVDRPTVDRGRTGLSISSDVPYAGPVLSVRPLVVTENYKRQISAIISRKLVEAYDHA